MGNYLSTKKEKTVKGIESYINCDDIHQLDNIILFFNKDKIKQRLSIYTDSFDFEFDYNFHLNVKFDDKFKYNYLRHSLAICLSFLGNEHRRLLYMMKGDSSGYITNVVIPLTNKLTFTLDHYTFFKPLHYNCVKIQRWYREKKK
jgi:hypothetical protein